MNFNLFPSVFLSLLLLLSDSLAHSPDPRSQNNGPLFGNVMRYFGESEVGYGLQNSGLFDDDNSQQVSMCLPNFEVSIGSIIRYKDSQTLGARFLNETDVGVKSRDDCLRLCCKVPRCNLAVFEEKNSGSCYLFDCGSLEDFHCKFTTQNHFVSAILRKRETPLHNSKTNGDHSSTSSNGNSIIAAHINEHSHNQHEEELTQLRGSDKAAAVAALAVGPASPNGSKSKQSIEINHASANGGSSTPIPVGLSDSNIADTRRCSRWQFECKSSGECIAIYNVCDQIPNCPDGSDESPELRCPVNNVYSTGNGDASGISNKHAESTSSLFMSPQQQVHHPQPPVPIGSGSKTITITNGNSPAAATVGMKTQTPLRQSEEFPLKQQPINTVSGGIINVPRKNEQSLNIFSHKDGGIMDDAFGNHQQQQPSHNYGQFWKQSPNYDYGNGEPQPGNLYGPIPPPPQYSNNGVQYAGNGVNYGGTQYQYGNGGYTNLQGSPQLSPPQNIPLSPYYQTSNNNYNLGHNVQLPQQIQQSNYNTNLLQGNNNGVPKNPATVQQQTNLRNDGAIVVPARTVPLNPSNQQAPHQVTTSKPTSNKQDDLQSNINNNSIKSITESSGKDSLSKLESEFIKTVKAQSLQTGLSEVQSDELSPHAAGAGAVFIFILGMGMSVVMVIIVGCRLRKVGRRQRGKNRLDPDYLVDGMYL